VTDPIRWGVLGAARFARSTMAPAIHSAPGHVLAALATRDRAKAAPFEALAPGLRVHGSYDALLADPEVDAVYVPLPHTLHVEWGVQALEAGKHVLVEKPVAMSEAQIAPLIAVRDRTGLVAAEAFMIVHHPQWAHMREVLASGAIGAVRHVDASFVYNNAADPANIRNAAATGGGALPDIGVYAIGGTRLALGTEPEAIEHAWIDWQDGVDLTARISARFPGASAQWLVSMRMRREQSLTVYGERGVLKMEAPFNPLGFGESRVTWWAEDGERRERRWPLADQYVAQVVAFGAAMRGAAPFPWTLEDAAGTQRAIDMVLAKAGGRPAG
jgi:predicted dehydrogenase